MREFVLNLFRMHFVGVGMRMGMLTGHYGPRSQGYNPGDELVDPRFFYEQILTQTIGFGIDERMGTYNPSKA